MKTHTLEELIARIEHLPRLNDTALRLVSVVSDPASTIEQIVDTIRYDQTVTSQVLRLCNSAYFGLARRISSVEDAIRYLGTTKVLQLVMAAHTHGLLGRPQEGYGLPPGELWLHSVGVALAGQSFAQRFGLGQAGLVFTSGLLHDLGKVVLNESVALEYAEIARMVNVGGVSFLDAERQVLGFTHPEIGALVAQRWNLPERMTHAIRYHHEPDLVEEPDTLLDAIHLADSVCRLVGVGCGYDGLLYRADQVVMARHNVGTAELEAVGAETVAELKQVQKLFATRQD